MSQKDNEQEKTNDNLLQTTIGNFGRWQLKISVLMALLKFPIAWFQLSIVFLAPPTQFWCKNSKFNNHLLRHEGLNSGYCQTINESNQTIDCQNGFEYNKTIFHSSIVTEWDLVCDNKRLVDITQISFMLGFLIGNVVFGVLADKYGRKITLMTNICFQAIFGILAAWVPYFWAFVFLRFLLAMANGGITVISFVMCMEVVGGIWRTIVPILYQIPFGFGNSIMAGLAYFFNNWRELQFTISLLSMIYVFYFWFIPESPRWLLVVGKKNEAIEVLKQAAKSNKLDQEKIDETVMSFSKKTVDQHENIPTVSVLFQSKELKKRMILLCVNWLIGGITFFAFSQYPGKIARNIYFTVAISGFVALPGTFFCVYIVGRFGRRWTITAAHLLTAVCFLAILLTPSGVYLHDWPRVLFAGIGIIGLSISLPALYLFTGELIPTSLRNAGVGIAIMFSRIGSMLAPLVITLQDISPHFPLLLLTILAVIEAILILFLPETKGVLLPETVHDLEAKYQQPSKINNSKSYVSLSQGLNDES